MAVSALTGFYVAVAASTTGGTAPGGATAPTGCSLSSASDISSFVTNVEAGVDVDTQDVTTFGSGGYKAFVAGLKGGVVNLTLLNDYAASQLNSLIGTNGSVIPVGSTGFIEVRPTSSARSATNPGFIAKIINNGYRLVNAGVGQVPTVSWNVTVTLGFAELTA